MENCRFKVFNYKYNSYLPCELLSKIDNRIWKVKEYYQSKNGNIDEIITCTFIDYIENI